MFQRIVNEPGSSDNIALVKDAAKIQAILRTGTVAEAYALFRDTLYPQLQNLKGTLPHIVKEQVGSNLFPKVAAELAKDFGSSDFPTVARLTELMVELDVMKPAIWGTLMVHLLEAICSSSASPNDYSSVLGYETAMARRDVLLHDLFDAWKAFGPWETESKPDGEEDAISGGADSASAPNPIGGDLASLDLVEDSSLPATDQSKPQRRPDFHNAFADLFPNLPRETLLRPSWAAIATYKVLADTKQQNITLWQKASPFLDAMGQLLAKTRLPNLAKNDGPPFAGCPPSIGSTIRQFLGHPLHKGRVEWKPPTPAANAPSEAAVIQQQLGQAFRSRNVRDVKKAWAKFWGVDPTPSEARVERLREMGSMFDYFISVYMAMRETQLALSVWDSMVQAGVQPTINTYTSMMRGCAAAKNAAGINAVWKRLAASGLQLDVPAWTARISGLITSNDLDGSIAALNEMAHIWRQREDPKYAAIAVQPSVEPVNAILVALIRLNRLTTAKNVLSWAAKQGIDPDVYTFNILLRPLLRQGHIEEVQDMLAMMRSLNIQPDSATFTILLEVALVGIGSKPAEEQVQTVQRTIRDVESAGVAANMETYGKMVYILLEEENADPAVKAVLAHIWGRGLELSRHIYTMLAEYYFTRSPPDADAVTALIENRGLKRNGKIDRVFWERVIKGYCKVGQVDKALEVFSGLSRDGSAITFSTLYDFLLALLDSGLQSEAKGVVRTAKEYKDEVEETEVNGVTPAKNGRWWKHRFWHLAEQNGLLEDGILESFQASKEGRP
ncbi:hypothetical protein OQA88_7607 [Cercophora sp. LCS_1]